MRFKYKMPDLSETASDFEVLEWKVPEGEVVEEDDPLLEISTDKATMEIPAPVTARVLKHLVAVGESITAGTAIVELEVS